MNKNEMNTVSFYCRKCGKSLKMEYVVTGNPDTPILNNMVIRCNTNKCTRVMIPKKFTEGQIINKADVQGRYFL